MSVNALEFNPYSTVAPMFTAVPQWMPEYDAQRIAAYATYEQIYWSIPNTFKLTARGSEDKPIYVPTGKTIVDTTNRYVGKDFGVVLDPDLGTPADRMALHLELVKLFRRERFYGGYNMAKRYGMIRGDWMIHVMGNDLKPAGTRIKLEWIDPAAYFPVPHPDDPDRLIGCHLVEQFETEDGVKLKRQTYQKGADPINNDGTDTTIYNSIAVFDMESWESLSAKPVTIIKPITALPPQITALPVYHIKNIETPGDPFGSSELRGVERIMGAVNQAISDEELALALEGLGMYWTDAGPPRDPATNEPTDWVFGPGRVVELPNGKRMDRLTGVSNVSPVQDHLGFLIQSLKEASATPDVAIGKVETSVAESGISLALQMGPMLAKADEREETISSVLDNFLFDLTTMWMPAYELMTFNAIPVSGFGDRLPTNKAEKIKEILDIVAAQLASAEWGRAELSKLGFVFDATEGTKVTDEMKAQAAIDPMAVRLAAESRFDTGA